MAISRRMKAVLAVSVVTLWAGPALAQGSIKDRLNRLESAVQDLQGTVYSVEQSAYGPSDAAPGTYESAEDYGNDLSVRIGQLERELQSLTGRIEQVAYQIEQNSRRLDTITAAMTVDGQPGESVAAADGNDSFNAQYSRMTDTPAPATQGPTDLSRSGAFTGTTGEPVVAETSIDCSGMMPGDANRDYDYAFDALLNSDYMTAECAFKNFLENHGSDPGAPDAQFRLGEIYLTTGANVEAARAFLNHIKTWPNDARAAESYLKLGTAYARLDKRQEACKVFEVMQAKFPNMSTANRQRLAIERGNAGC